MMDALYSAATGMSAQQVSMDAIAHNLSNVSTTGFKATRVSFQDLLYQQVGSRQAAADGAQIGMGVGVGATRRRFEQGELVESGQPGSMAIEGSGFFEVDNGGQPAYTRDGSFQVDAKGQLVTASGRRLVPTITIPAGADMTTLSIGPTGAVTVSAGGKTTTLGQIKITTFANPEGLQAVGDNMYTASANSGAASTGVAGTGGRGQLRNGFLEQANVSVMDEMVNMISAQRAFESVAKVISTSDEMLGMANAMRR